jgi:hypothetical protein
MRQRRRKDNSGDQPRAVRFSRVTLLGVLAVLACADYQPLGGGWSIRRPARLPEAGPRVVELYRGESWRRTRIASGVVGWFYYGSDCLAYVTAQTSRVYVGCGERAAVRLDTSGVRGEIVSPELKETGVEYFTTAGPSGTVAKLRFDRDRLLSAAMRQGLRANGAVDGATVVRPSGAE